MGTGRGKWVLEHHLTVGCFLPDQGSQVACITLLGSLSSQNQEEALHTCAVPRGITLKDLETKSFRTSVKGRM